MCFLIITIIARNGVQIRGRRRLVGGTATASGSSLMLMLILRLVLSLMLIMRQRLRLRLMLRLKWRGRRVLRVRPPARTAAQCQRRRGADGADHTSGGAEPRPERQRQRAGGRG